MALTAERIAVAVIKDCKRRRMANYEIRRRRSELVGQWLRSTPWFLKYYPTMEKQEELYRQVEHFIFKKTCGPKKQKAYHQNPTPLKDPRNLKLL